MNNELDPYDLGEGPDDNGSPARTIKPRVQKAPANGQVVFDPTSNVPVSQNARLVTMEQRLTEANPGDPSNRHGTPLVVNAPPLVPIAYAAAAAINAPAIRAAIRGKLVRPSGPLTQLDANFDADDFGLSPAMAREVISGVTSDKKTTSVERTETRTLTLAILYDLLMLAETDPARREQIAKLSRTMSED